MPGTRVKPAFSLKNHGLPRRESGIMLKFFCTPKVVTRRFRNGYRPACADVAPMDGGNTNCVLSRRDNAFCRFCSYDCRAADGDAGVRRHGGVDQLMR